MKSDQKEKDETDGEVTPGSQAQPSARAEAADSEATELADTHISKKAEVTFTGVPSDREALIGTMVDGRYFVESHIGDGGMGVVYACRHTIIDKRVAIKVLRTDMAKRREAAERFLNEARSASSIGNAHIIDISDFGQLQDGSAYFVMEYLDGIPLVAIADEQVPQDPSRILRIALQLTDGLAAAHRAGIIHRDLKPDNVFLVKQGTVEEFVKILDFGIAKATASTSKLTQAGQIFGTPHYMSPEQADGARIDQRTDIYSLGVILYELLTGRLPFDAENYMAVLTQHMHRDPTPPSTIEDLKLALPPGLEELILRCLMKSPKDRFQSMEELGGELRNILCIVEGFIPDGIDPSGRVSRITQTSGQAATQATPPPPSKSHTLIYTLVALLTALLSGGIAWMTRSAPTLAPTPGPELSAPNVPEATSEVPALPPSEKGEPEAPAVQVRVLVSPQGARIFEGNNDLGVAPLDIAIKNGPRTLKARRAGYLTQSFIVNGEIPQLSINLKKQSSTQKEEDSPSPTAAPRRAPSRPHIGRGSDSDYGGDDLPAPW